MKYALKNMYILNGHEDMEPEKGKAILVDGEKISDIVDENAIPEGYEVKDLGGKYLLPGLINLHIHIPSSGKPKKGGTNYDALMKLLKLGVVKAVVKKMCESNVKQQLLSGTTTVRAVGGVMDFDTYVRDRINSGKIAGPRILAANYAVSVPGGHMTGSVAMPANSPEEAAQMVDDLKNTNPDLIKLMITGGVLDAIVPGEPGILKMPPEYVKAAVDRAHSYSYKVAAHVEGNEGMLVALRNGVDTIEHGGKTSDEVVELFKETGKTLVVTLSPAAPFIALEPGDLGMTEMYIVNGRALMDQMVENAKKCRASGVRIGLGTDTGCPYTTHYDTWRELWYYSHFIGASPKEAIHTATQVNSEIAGVSEITGTVDIGKSADFMIVEGNPLDDLKNLRKASMVVMRGKIIDNPQPKRIPEVDSLLDKFMESLELSVL